MQRSISKYKMRKKIVEALRENSFVPLADLGARYGISRQAVWAQIRHDKSIPIKQRKYLTWTNDCDAVLELYQKAPCLLEECITNFDYPIELERVAQVRRARGIFNWGRIKLCAEDITLKRLVPNVMKPINAYFLGVIFFNARIDINPLGKKVVFLFMPLEMEAFIRRFIWFIKNDRQVTYVTQNKFYDYQRKIIIESDELYDLIDKMRMEGIRVARPVPHIIPKELRKYFLQGIFDVGGQLFKRKYNKRDKTLKRICFKIQGNQQLSYEHFYNLKTLFQQELKGILPNTQRTMKIGEQQKFFFLWWEYIPNVQKIYDYVYENKEETIFSNIILHERLQEIFRDPPKIMKGD